MPDKSKKLPYDDSQVIAAIAAVKNGSSFNAAAIKHGVPLSTLRDRYYGKYNPDKHKPGPSTYLSEEQEELLQRHILSMAKIGYGVSKKDVKFLIQEILNKAEAEDPDNYSIENRKFKENLPSTGWVYNFFKRHPILAARTPENLGHQRSCVTKGNIKFWFESLVNFLKEEHQIDAHDFLQEKNADRIFNLDESGFPLAGTNGKLKIITARGAKNVYKMAPDTKEQITVLGCVSAAGNYSKPFVIFPGIKPKYNLQHVNPDDYDLGSSKSGWISADSFFGWLVNLFFPSIKDKVQFPVLIFMDGHTSHINLAIATFCKENHIILYIFPPHASHIMQPLDVAVYGPLKKHWNAALYQFGIEFKGLSMNKSHFFKVFDSAWKKSIQTPQNAVAGFRKCGLVPLNPEAVDYDRLIEKTVHVPPVKKSQSSYEERIGITRAFQLFENCLSEEISSLFANRYANSYDIEDTTDRGMMYSFYRKCRRLVEDEKVDVQAVAEDAEAVAEDTQGAAEDAQGTAEDAQGAAKDAQAVAEDTHRLDLNGVSQSDNKLVLPIDPCQSILENVSIAEPNPVILEVNECSFVIDTCSQNTELEKINSTPSTNFPSTSFNLPSSPSREGVNSPSMSVDLVNLSPITGDAMNLPSTSAVENQPGASSSNMFENFAYSPFKKHLVISPSLVIKRKVPLSKLKTPPAISGREYTEYATKLQEEKKKKIDEQEQRKRKREEKKKNPTKPKPRKKSTKRNLIDTFSGNETEEDDTINCIVFADSSDEDIEQDEYSACYACLSKEQWNNPDSWIGCSGNKCKRWFHKMCISDNLVKMTKQELKHYDHYCNLCRKKK